MSKESIILYINKYINILPLDKKKIICKIILTYNVNLIQTNNGVYCKYTEIDDKLLDTIFNYIKSVIK